MRFAYFIGLALVAACTNDFDRFDFDGEGGGGAPTTTTSVASVGGGPASTSVTTSTGMPDCTSPVDCPGIDTDCQQKTCTNGVCGFDVELAGTPCNDGGGNLCDGSGQCAQCLTNTDCETFADGGLCDNGSCLPADCLDGLQNNDETDVDCGGATCDPCIDGLMCLVPSDCASGVCTGNLCVACTTEADCAPLGAFWCDAGSCAPQGAAGDPCALDVACQSGFCPADDGVCCDAACSGLCESCLMAETGAADGTCAPVSAGTDPKGECTPSVASCTADFCNGAAQCEAASAAVTCRPAMGLCDVAESCNGVTTGCPTDAKQPSTAVCRIAVDVCDATETCDGVGNACPADMLQPASFTCRFQAGPCDVAETCDGVTTACPSDAFLPDGSPSAGGTCNPYLCDGTQASCPTSCAAPADCVAPATCAGTTCQ